MDGENGHSSHLSSPSFQADTKIAFEFPLLRQRLQRFQVIRTNVFTRLEFNRRVIPQNKIDFEAGLSQGYRFVTTLSSHGMPNDDYTDTCLYSANTALRCAH